METQGMTQQTFAQKLGLSPATISSLFTGRTNPTHKHVMAIHEAFPTININWLMFGEGAMMNDGETSEADEAELLATPSEGHSAALPSTPTVTPQTPAEAAVLFSEAEMAAPIRGTKSSPYGAQMGRNSGAMAAAQMFQNINGQEKIIRKIKEIRVFYDDGTYEAFSPSK